MLGLRLETPEECSMHILIGWVTAGFVRAQTSSENSLRNFNNKIFLPFLSVLATKEAEYLFFFSSKSS